MGSSTFSILAGGVFSLFLLVRPFVAADGFGGGACRWRFCARLAFNDVFLGGRAGAGGRGGRRWIQSLLSVGQPSRDGRERVDTNRQKGNTCFLLYPIRLGLSAIKSAMLPPQSR